MPIEIPSRTVETLEKALDVCRERMSVLREYYESFRVVTCQEYSNDLYSQLGAEFDFCMAGCKTVTLPEPAIALALGLGALCLLASPKIRADLLGRTASRSRRG